ncbi:MAG: hypothetical protein K8S27_13610 [Candidatus Omnitrophica bacterium]|nr:hypothetical protein [Candidatus Omnitrophota bacterium]
MTGFSQAVALFGQTKPKKEGGGATLDESYQVLKKAIDAVGIKKVAVELGLSTSLLYKWCQRSEDINEYQSASGAANPLDRLQKLYELTNDSDIINWLCQNADGFFVPNPTIDKKKRGLHVVENMQGMIREFSETLDTIIDCYNNGNRIDSDESKRIRAKWEELKQFGEFFVSACESGKFDKKPSKGKTKRG